MAALAAATTDETRAEAFRSVLNRHVGPLIGRLDGKLNKLPVLISGMAGSSIGWQDVSYSPLPFSLDGRDVTWQDVGSLGDGLRVSNVFVSHHATAFFGSNSTAWLKSATARLQSPSSENILPRLK